MLVLLLVLVLVLLLPLLETFPSFELLRGSIGYVGREREGDCHDISISYL